MNTSQDDIALALAYERASGLDTTTLPAFRDRIVATESEGIVHEPRSYPGYPRVALGKVHARPWPALEHTLAHRRSHRQLATRQPSRPLLSRLLHFAHGSNADRGRGPTPSAGGMQGLELYVVAYQEGWLPTGVYHYDRGGHTLARLREGATRERWADIAPSFAQFSGGALLWLLVGDSARVCGKYGARGYRLLLLEAGHLMQSLCLLSDAYGFCTLPLGGFCEREVVRTLALAEGDLVVHAGAFGAAVLTGV